MSAQLRRARIRLMFIFLLVCLGFFTLLARLYYWQVLQSQSGYKLAQRADTEHIKNLTLDAPRGLIYDIQGKLLATNVLRDDVYIEPLQFTLDHPDAAQGELEELITTLHQVLPKESVEKLHLAFASGQYTARIAIGIDPSQSEQLRTLQLPDVFLVPRTWRIYPGGSLAAQILGFVTQNDSNNRGNYGIEGMYDALLKGKPGSLTAVRDLQGYPLDVGSINEQPPISGANLTLTIDNTVEYMVSAALADTVKNLQAESGTVVVINAHTGAVVAMAGAPTFDPNHYGQYATQQGCLGSEGVFFNPALYCAYEPGSTMKMVTMAAALDQRLITPDTTLNDTGCMTFTDAPIVCNWQYMAYGTESMTQVLIHSANVGAAHVAHDILGANRYYPYLSRFGFGQPTGIDGPEEAGIYLSPNNQNWTISDLTRQAFGQSILATPIQVAMAYEVIANGGVMMYPYLVSKINADGKVVTAHPKIERRVISADAAKLLTEMLTQAAQLGSAKPAQIPGYSVAAKTGTATTQGISADQTEASVVGFIPASNPQFVILVKIDHPRKAIYGSTAAAPLWKTIAQQLMWYYAVPPDQAH